MARHFEAAVAVCYRSCPRSTPCHAYRHPLGTCHRRSEPCWSSLGWPTVGLPSSELHHHKMDQSRTVPVVSADANNCALLALARSAISDFAISTVMEGRFLLARAPDLCLATLRIPRSSGPGWRDKLDLRCPCRRPLPGSVAPVPVRAGDHCSLLLFSPIAICFSSAKKARLLDLTSDGQSFIPSEFEPGTRFDTIIVL